MDISEYFPAAQDVRTELQGYLGLYVRTLSVAENMEAEKTITQHGELDYTIWLIHTLVVDEEGSPVFASCEIIRNMAFQAFNRLAGSFGVAMNRISEVVNGDTPAAS